MLASFDRSYAACGPCIEFSIENAKCTFSRSLLKLRAVLDSRVRPLKIEILEIHRWRMMKERGNIG